MTPYSPPKIQDATIDYRLVTHEGRSRTTQRKRWFFEVPMHFVGPARWLELVQRIFYDANVVLQRRDPSDYAWFEVSQVRVREVDAKAMLTWDGKTLVDSEQTPIPWVFAERRRVWELSACYVVTDDGHYGPLPAASYTELVACRARSLAQVDDLGLASFLDKVFPGEGPDRASQWQERLETLRRVDAPAGEFRRAPGSRPEISGPPTHSDVEP